jgi:hypothetical protein
MCSRQGLPGVWGAERIDSDGGNWGGPPRPGDLRKYVIGVAHPTKTGGQYGRNSNYLGELESVFNEHAVELTPVEDVQAELNDYLLLIGRVTGRFIDQDWLTSQRAISRIPDGAWTW